jgi:hypothetical protein
MIRSLRIDCALKKPSSFLDHSNILPGCGDTEKELDIARSKMRNCVVKMGKYMLVYALNIVLKPALSFMSTGGTGVLILILRREMQLEEFFEVRAFGFRVALKPPVYN